MSSAPGLDPGLISHLNPWVDPGPGPRSPQAIHHDSDRVPDTRTARAASHHLRDGSLIECGSEPTAQLIPPHPRGEPTAPSRRNGRHQRPPTAPRHDRHGTQPAAAWSRARLLIRRPRGGDASSAASGVPGAEAEASIRGWQLLKRVRAGREHCLAIEGDSETSPPRSGATARCVPDRDGKATLRSGDSGRRWTT